MSNEDKKYLWITYLLAAPVFFYIVYYNFDILQSIVSIDYLLFLILAVLTTLFPIKSEHSILFLINGVSLATFVVFGLLPEMIISSIALLILMIRSNIRWDDNYRYALNLLMFHSLSIISALFFYMINTITQSYYHSYNIFALSGYMFIYFISNQVILFFVNRYLFKEKSKPIIDSEFKFSIITTLVMIPLAFILLYLYDELGTNGILIGSLPFITITIGTNIYFKNKTANDYLNKVNSAAQNLTGKKIETEVIKTYLKSLTTIFPVDALSYFSVSSIEENIKRKHIYQKGGGVKNLDEDFKISADSVLNSALSKEDILYYNSSKDWKQQCESDLTYDAESALFLPVKNQENIVGLILLSHRTKFMYDNALVSLVKIFHQYFSIALDNAYQYESLEDNSETDYLTGLPNLRGFSNYLETILQNKMHSEISLIVIDLDHFKETNDTYGHQAGNEVLKEIAQMISSFIENDIHVARYGGEEFVVLLPGYSKEKAINIAEQIRKTIEESTILVRQSIHSKEMVAVRLTASSGVATYPTDSTDIDELITLADRAMYIGSKQKGRNRVTAAQSRGE